MAIEGIRSQFGDFGGDFVYGHWAKHLPLCLLWFNSDMMGTERHPNALVVPTWSWASSSSAVGWRYYHNVYVNKCEVVSLPTASFPRITLRGRIRILGEDVGRQINGYIGVNGVTKPDPSVDCYYQMDGNTEYAAPIFSFLVAYANSESCSHGFEALILHRTSLEMNTYKRVEHCTFQKDELFQDCPLQEIVLE